MHHVTVIALQWFRASGERTPEKLANLVRSTTATYAINTDTTAEILREALTAAGWGALFDNPDDEASR